MKRFLLCLSLLAGSFSLAEAADQTDRDAFSGRMIARAVHTDGRLWLLTGTGALSSFSGGGNKREPESSPSLVRDVCVANRQLISLTCDTKVCDTWEIK